MKKFFMLFQDSKEIIDNLTDEEAGKLLKAFYSYNETGETPRLERTLQFVFWGFKNQFVRDAEKYEAICERNRENGKKGGAPKGNQNAKKGNNQKVEKTTQTTQNNRVVEKTTQTTEEKEKEKEEEKYKEEYRLIFERINNISNAHARVYLSTFAETKDDAWERAKAFYGEDVANEYVSLLPLLVEICETDDVFADKMAKSKDAYLIKCAKAFADKSVADKKGYIKKACEDAELCDWAKYGNQT